MKYTETIGKNKLQLLIDNQSMQDLDNQIINDTLYEFIIIIGYRIITQRKINMQNIRSQLAEIISQKICKQLTSHLDYKSLKLQLEASRTQRAHQNAIQYVYTSLDQLREVNMLQPEGNINQLAIQNDVVQKNKQFGLGKRPSIVKIRRSILTERKNSSPCRLSKRFMKGSKQIYKGLVKLTAQQELETQFVDYIDKVRQKKIKYDDVMKQSDRERTQRENSKLKTTMRYTSHSDKPFITTFTGQLIKCEVREQNSKKDELYLQKVRVKPLFKLREHVSSRADAQKKAEFTTETRRVSISNQVKDNEEYAPKDDNYYIKSIIDVIANRNKLENVRRRRNVIR